MIDQEPLDKLERILKNAIRQNMLKIDVYNVLSARYRQRILIQLKDVKKTYALVQYLCHTFPDLMFCYNCEFGTIEVQTIQWHNEQLHQRFMKLTPVLESRSPNADKNLMEVWIAETEKLKTETDPE